MDLPLEKKKKRGRQMPHCLTKPKPSQELDNKSIESADQPTTSQSHEKASTKKASSNSKKSSKQSNKLKENNSIQTMVTREKSKRSKIE